MDGNAVGMPFDVHGDFRIAVEYSSQFTQGNLTLWIDDGAAGWGKKVFLQTDVNLAIFDGDGQFIGIEADKCITHLLTDVLDGLLLLIHQGFQLLQSFLLSGKLRVLTGD